MYKFRNMTEVIRFVSALLGLDILGGITGTGASTKAIRMFLGDISRYAWNARDMLEISEDPQDQLDQVQDTKKTAYVLTQGTPRTNQAQLLSSLKSIEWAQPFKGILSRIYMHIH